MAGSSYEVLTLRALRALFPHIYWQERIRPDWLKYTTGNNLELDLYQAPFGLAIEVQGPHHYRSVQGLASADKSQAQADRDTFKRHRCAERGVKLWTVSIFDLSLNRLYQLYRELHAIVLPKDPPMTKIDEVQAVVAEAARLAKRRVMPHGAKRKPYRKPGLMPLLSRSWSRIVHS